MKSQYYKHLIREQLGSRFPWYFAMFVLCTGISSMAAAEDVELLWKARGLKANEYLKSKKIKVKCKSNLEAAYSKFADPKFSDKTFTNDNVKISTGVVKRHIATLMIREGTERAVVQFIYIGSDPDPGAFKIIELPKGWTLYSILLESGFMRLGSKKCIYGFYYNRPLTADAFARK